MKEVTAILLILIALIGIISIIIVKLFYKDKEKDEEKEKLEEFINSTKADYDNERRKRVRKTNRRGYTQAQNYANTIDSSDRIKVGDLTEDEDYVETGKVGGTTALLRQRAKAMEEAPKKQVRRVRKPKPAPVEQVPRTPDRVKTQMNKEEEVVAFQEPIKPEHTATINSAKQAEKQPVARQVPMTEKQKEFIASDANKLVVDDSEGNVKVVKSVKPADTIEEIKEAAKIEEESAKTETDEIVEKAESETAKLIEKIEEAKGEIAVLEDDEDKVEEKVAEVAEEAKVEEEAKEETPKIESTIEKIKQASEAKEEAKEETKEEATEPVKEVEEVKEEPAIETKAKVEEKPKADEIIVEKAPKAEDLESDNLYHDDLHILLNKDAAVEEKDESPENEFVTINSEDEAPSTGNELINSAIKSIRNFRKANVPEKPVVVETKDDIVPDDYAQDLGDGIEYIGDTITITPIHEEERDLANNQPNEDVDKIYKEINKESYNKTDDEELSESYEDVTDETSEKDANVYTKEDYKKVERQEAEKKRRAENTKKILGSKGISEEELRQRAEAKERSKRARKTAVAEPVEEGQKTLMMHKARNDVEEVYINGTLFELKVGQIVMFDIKGETYSSQILRLKPGYIGVRYRSKNIWVKSNSVKKILR
jgi:hypothetical protein